MGSIYKITNTVNGKSYIGQTIHDAVKGRISEHFRGASNGSQLLKRAIKKHGKCVFIYKILHDGIIPELLDSYEIEAIAKFNAVAPKGYNLNSGGGGGKTPSEETRRKMSEVNKGKNNGFYGKNHSAETRRKLSEARKGKPGAMTGRKHSAEARRKLSEAHKGKKHTPETRRKMSESRKGKRRAPYSLETRRKMSEERKGKPGRPHTLETRRKMSEAQKHPMHEPSKELYFSLPADMSLAEKRKSIREFSGIHRDTIRRWTLKWESKN